MSVGKLIGFFSSFTKLPVYAEDVRDHIVEMGIQDQIEFHPMDVDPSRLLGLYVRYRHRGAVYGDHQNCSIIFYNVNVDPDEQNFICCKELMHVFDDGLKASVTNADELKKLLTTLFHDPIDPSTISISGFLDLAAEFVALAVMFPADVREQFKEAHRQGRMTVPQIAKHLGIPEKYLHELLLDKAEKLFDVLRAL